jgi:group I intron endonuclease
MAIVSGIYIILNRKNGKVYLGKTNDLKRRIKEHHSKLNCGHHDNRYLQASWNKHGAKAFQFKILERCPLEQLDEREKHHIAIYKARGLAYNLSDGGEGASGAIRSPETRLKMSKAQKGRTITPEARRKLSEANTGFRHTEETLAKMREVHTGKLHTEETKRKIAESHKTENLSEEYRRKLSEGAKRREARKRAERDKAD